MLIKLVLFCALAGVLGTFVGMGLAIGYSLIKEPRNRNREDL